MGKPMAGRSRSVARQRGLEGRFFCETVCALTVPEITVED